ncbi:MAG: pyridoxamine 5'-phosphate oxidase, partial [Acidiferrobacterales bacterium]
NPLIIFENWFNQAKESDIDKPNAMTLATVGNHGQVHARIVLLSSFDINGFVFHANYKSDKGAQLAANPSACLLFWWDCLGYQVRINGQISKTTTEESDAYFSGRPRGSQVGAWASEQSQVIKSRQVLYDREAEFEIKYSGKEVPRPAHWGGYRLSPTTIEFWVNQENRLHERTLYTRQKSGSWEQIILAP